MSWATISQTLITVPTEVMNTWRVFLFSSHTHTDSWAPMWISLSQCDWVWLHFLSLLCVPAPCLSLVTVRWHRLVGFLPHSTPTEILTRLSWYQNCARGQLVLCGESKFLLWKSKLLFFPHASFIVDILSDLRHFSGKRWMFYSLSSLLREDVPVYLNNIWYINWSAGFKTYQYLLIHY